jgi:glc operon protein GlcG
MMNRKFDYIRKVVHDIVAEGIRQGVDLSVHAVDMDGRTTVAMRSDRADFLSDEPAQKKAMASKMLRMPTNGAIKMMEGDPVIARAMLAINDILIVPGGMPLYLDDDMIGAVGAAGGHYNIDHQLVEMVVLRHAKAEKDASIGASK